MVRNNRKYMVRPHAWLLLAGSFSPLPQTRFCSGHSNAYCDDSTNRLSAQQTATQRTPIRRRNLGSFFGVSYGGHSIAPKTASANAANAKVRNRQMIGRPIIL